MTHNTEIFLVILRGKEKTFSCNSDFFPLRIVCLQLAILFVCAKEIKNNNNNLARKRQNCETKSHNYRLLFFYPMAETSFHSYLILLTYSWNCCDYFSQFEFVEDCGFSCCIQTNWRRTGIKSSQTHGKTLVCINTFLFLEKQQRNSLQQVTDLLIHQVWIHVNIYRS